MVGLMMVGLVLKENRGYQYQDSLHVIDSCLSTVRALINLSTERSCRSSQVRATKPVMFATAKLIPLRFRATGTPGNGRGKPEAQKIGAPPTRDTRYSSRERFQSTSTLITSSNIPGSTGVCSEYRGATSRAPAVVARETRVSNTGR